MMIEKTAGLACALALVATPAWATVRPAATPHGNSGQAGAHQPTAAPGLATKAKAYGRYCKTESKKRSDAADGTTGSPFSQCVTAMAELANGQEASPSAACKMLSKKRADAQPGTKGTPFSQCVSGAAKLLRDHATTS
jgi:hypothetical protein